MHIRTRPVHPRVVVGAGVVQRVVQLVVEGGLAAQSNVRQKNASVSAAATCYPVVGEVVVHEPLRARQVHRLGELLQPLRKNNQCKPAIEPMRGALTRMASTSSSATLAGRRGSSRWYMPLPSASSGQKARIETFLSALGVSMQRAHRAGSARPSLW